MAGKRRWWVAFSVCAALSAVPVAAALLLSSEPPKHSAPSPPLARSEPEPVDTHDSAKPAHADPERFDVPPPLDEPPQSDEDAAEPGSIAGRVVDERGFPVPSFEVAIEGFWPSASVEKRAGRRRTSIVDADGRFVLDGLGSGGYVLAVRADGRPPVLSERIELNAGEEERGVRIVLGPGGAVGGRVREVGGGAIEGARISLDLASAAFGSTASAVSDDGGGYRLEGVPKGPLSIRFEADGYVTQILSAVSARAGEEARQDVELRKADGDAATEYAGVGAMLSVDGQGVLFGNVLEGGPAERAGIQRGDRLVRVDGEDARGWTVAQAVQRLRGTPGSRVSVRVSRSGEELDVLVTRERFVR